MTAPDECRLVPEAVASLYEEHAPELLRFLTGLLRDGSLAQDIMQATFAKLVERGHETREESRKGWLFRVAYREAMAYRRRQNVDDRAVRRLAWGAELAESADMAVVRRETIDRVRDLLMTLPVEQATVVRMRVYEEKTFAMIAEELGIPLGTALYRMHTAMGKLRAKLTQD